MLRASDLIYSPRTSVLDIGFDWYPYQWCQCRFGGARTGFLFSPNKIQSSHHQIYSGSIDMDINQVLSSKRRCKDWI